VLPEALLHDEDEDEDDDEDEDEQDERLDEKGDAEFISSRVRFLRHAASCVLSAPLLLTSLPQTRHFP